MEWSLWQLHNRLVANAMLFETAEIQNQRDAVADSLLAVHDYLSGRGFAPATIAPLMRPIAALVERENNSLDLLFVERPRGGRPKATMADNERTGVLAALADYWLETHATDDRRQSEKLAEAARKMKGRWFRGVTAAKLKTARDLVKQEARDHAAVTEAARFSETIAMINDRFGSADAFSIIVRMLNDLGPMHDAVTKISKTPRISPTEER